MHSPVSKSHSLSQTLSYPPAHSDPNPDALLRFPTLSHPVMDPADFRAFYPYTPNEVKHRKRTTSDQLKVLESIFEHDTKPNGVRRNDLALQLDMTPRGVQVWFQNRRAKEKTKAGKASKAAAKAPPASATDYEQSPSPSEVYSTTDAQFPAVPRAVNSHHPSPATPSSSSSPQMADSKSWQASANQEYPPHKGGDPNLLRRGSLPVDMVSHLEHRMMPSHLDPFKRRLSVDASLHRLGGSNPYASFSLAKTASRISGPSPTRNQSVRVAGSPYPRPELSHIASAPVHGSFLGRRFSTDTEAMHYHFNGAGIASSPRSTHPHHSSLPDHHSYVFSSRAVGSMIPGPLPSPNFSFGVANTNVPSLTPTSSADSESSSPDPVRCYAFQGDESEDDHTSSYDASSRFGSIASIATSESSYYSDCPPDHDIPPNVSRRGSCNSNQFLGMMSDLDVNGMGDPVHTIDNFSPKANPGQNCSGVANVYPSPASTLSPGSTSSLVNESSASQSLPISRSSELNFALQGTPDQSSGSQSPYVESSAKATSSPQPSTYMYVAESAYLQEARPQEGFQYEQQQVATNYYPTVLYNMDGSYCHHATEGGSMTRFDRTSSAYGTYGTNEHMPQATTDFNVSYP